MSQDEIMEDLPGLLAEDPKGNFRLLVEAYESPLLRHARNWTRNHQDAEEIVQETFLRAWRDLKRRPAESIRQLHLWSWLYRIALNYFLNTIRKKVPIIEHGPFPEIESPSEDQPENVVIRTECRREWESLIAGLPQYQEELKLFYFEGLSIQEIAEHLGRPVGTVKSNLNRGRKLLRLVMAIAKLPPQCREEMYLFYVERLRIKEIAERLGKSVETVESNLCQGRELLPWLDEEQ